MKDKQVNCNRCNTEVQLETKKMDGEYPYYCPECDENMYVFETHATGGSNDRIRLG